MIRDATAADLPRLVAMGREFLHGTAYAALIADNPDQMAALASRLIDHATGVVLVADHAGELTGMIGVLVTPHHLSAEPVAMECFFWSSDGAGPRLMRAAETWARGKGAVGIQMVAPNDRVGAFYERFGYALIERGYMKRFAA